MATATRVNLVVVVVVRLVSSRTSPGGHAFPFAAMTSRHYAVRTVTVPRMLLTVCGFLAVSVSVVGGLQHRDDVAGNLRRNSSKQNYEISTDEGVAVRCRPCMCGVGYPGSRIVGGTQVRDNEYPWMASLWNSRRRFFCGGSVVTDQYVLTAAHCFSEDPESNYRDVYAMLGQVKRPHRLYVNGPHVVRASVVKLHQKYNQNGLNVHDNDIALVKLARPVKFNHVVRPICLPMIRYDYEGLTATVAGWGQMSEISPTSLNLRHAIFPLWSDKECEQVPGFTKTGYTDNMLCAGLKSGGKDSCQGDSGGPLMVYDNNEKITVAGIVSWGIGCGLAGLPGVYTRVDKYLGWIMRHTRDSCHCTN